MRSDVQRLATAIEAIERRAAACASDQSATKKALPTGWPVVDQTLHGGLLRGAIHEWFGVAQTTPRQADAPLSILSHLAWQAIQAKPSSGQAAIWIGQRCWPHVSALVRQDNRALLERSLFVQVPDDAARLWAIDLVLRSSAVAIVIADGRRLDMAASRRLQLAAEAGGSLALLARPPHELSMLSAAATRWRVLMARTSHTNPRWMIQLLRCKGMQPSAEAGRGWDLEWRGAQGIVNLSADVVDRSGEAARSDSIKFRESAVRISA